MNFSKNACSAFKMAERKGFEPLVKLEPHTDVPGLHLKPLGHLSLHAY